MSRVLPGQRPAFDPAAPVEQARLFSAIADLARLGAQEPLEDALDRIDESVRQLGQQGDLMSVAQLQQIRSACDELASSLSAEQRQVMQDLAEIQGRILQRRRYAGGVTSEPGLDRRG